MSAVELVPRDDPHAPAVLYACSDCGAAYSPALYADAASGHEKARAAASECYACKSAAETDTPENEEDRRERAIAAATEVSDLEFCFSDRGDTAYPSPEDARDAGETGVFGADFQPYHASLDHILQEVVEGHHHSASIDDLIGVDALAEAIEEFNAKQTGGSYEMDSKRWQRLRNDQTFAMIKPDATARGVEEQMISDIEAAGFTVVSRHREIMERADAEWLYREHSAKGHFGDLVDYTISGPVEMLLLQADDDNAPARFRELMGPTDRTKAGPHTLRGKYAIGLRENSVHGSDGPASAIDEILRFMRGS